MQTNARLLDLSPEQRIRVARHLETHSTPAPDGCILYTGWLTPKGYGRFSLNALGKTTHVRVHRGAWILAYGAIPDATLVVDHLCRNRACINPQHLELVAAEENLRRGNRPWTDHSSKEPSCRNGHPWTPETIGFEINGARKPGLDRIRYCRRCKQLRLPYR